MPLTKPWLHLPARWAHDLGPYALRLLTYGRNDNSPEWRPFDWRGLHFRNRLGIAGGVDKTGKSLSSWWKLGPGFLEVGTVTPEPQSANPGIIIRRDVGAVALWNKMGFPNTGMESLRHELSRLPRPYPTPLFVNVGKNRWTKNEEAHGDYLKCMDGLNDFADAFVVNISSPNTSGLRDLQQGQGFVRFISTIADHKSRHGIKPILIKLSPDMPEDQLHFILETGLEYGIDGWILTNTTQSRPAGLGLPAEGGLSGAPLSAISKEMLKKTVDYLGDRKNGRLIVSVGGILSSEDVLERIAMGADLVQAYAAIVFEGPFFFLNTLKKLNRLG